MAKNGRLLIPNGATGKVRQIAVVPLHEYQRFLGFMAKRDMFLVGKIDQLETALTDLRTVATEQGWTLPMMPTLPVSVEEFLAEDAPILAGAQTS